MAKDDVSVAVINEVGDVFTVTIRRREGIVAVKFETNGSSDQDNNFGMTEEEAKALLTALQEIFDPEEMNRDAG